MGAHVSSGNPGDVDTDFNGGNVDLSHTGDRGRVISMKAVDRGGVLVLSVTYTEYYVTRFNALGRLDESFSAGHGFFLVSLPPLLSCNTLEVMEDGSFLVCGGFGNEVFSAKYTQDGGIDSAYGENGLAVVDIRRISSEGKTAPPKLWRPEADSARETVGVPAAFPSTSGKLLSVLDNGQVYLVFTVYWGGDDELMTVVLRLNSDGSHDRQYGENGYFPVTLAGTPHHYNFAGGVSFDEGGLILCVALSYGWDEEDPGERYLLRVSEKGVQDWTFGGSGDRQGYVRFSKDDVTDVQALLVEGANKLKVVGTLDEADQQWGVVYAIERDGKPDMSFNGGQPWRVQFETGYGLLQTAYSKGEGSDYRLVLCARRNTPELSIGAVKLLGSGLYDREFGVNGTVFYPAPEKGFYNPGVVTPDRESGIFLGGEGTIYKLL